MTLENALIKIFGVREEELPVVLSFFKRELFPARTHFLRQGKPVERIGFIEEGITREYFIEEERETTKFIGTPGAFISDVSGVNFGYPSRWNIITVTDCVIHTLYLDDIAEMRNRLPRWSDIEKQFTAKCLLSAENRILEHLKYNAEERYVRLFKQMPHIFNYVELKHIASFLGITPETLSRFRRKTEL